MIVRRESAAAVLGLEDLRGRSVASPDRLPLEALLAEQAPGAQLLAPAPLDHALSLLRAGLVDAVIANLAEVEAALRAGPGDPLVIAAPAGFGDALVVAAVPACAGVIAAFDQQLRQEDDAHRASGHSAWRPERPRAQPAGATLRWLVPASLVLLALALVHAFGYWRVHRESTRRRVLEQRLQEVTANLPAVVYQARRSATGHYSLTQIAGDVQALFGVSVETARIDHFQLLAAVHPDDRSRVMACIEAAALARGPIDVTFRTRSAQGWRWVRSQGRPLPCDDSSVEWSGYWMDVSEAQARATALADARRAAEQAALAKSHFLATMSHEIRTPMSTLLGMLERLAGGPLDAGQQQVLGTVADAAQMLRQILDDVLHSQRLQPARCSCARPTWRRWCGRCSSCWRRSRAAGACNCTARSTRHCRPGRWPMGCACGRSCSTWPAMHSSSPAGVRGVAGPRAAAARGRPAAAPAGDRHRRGHQRGTATGGVCRLRAGRGVDHAPFRRQWPGAVDLPRAGDVDGRAPPPAQRARQGHHRVAGAGPGGLCGPGYGTGDGTGRATTAATGAGAGGRGSSDQPAVAGTTPVRAGTAGARLRRRPAGLGGLAGAAVRPGDHRLPHAAHGWLRAGPGDPERRLRHPCAGPDHCADRQRAGAHP